MNLHQTACSDVGHTRTSRATIDCCTVRVLLYECCTRPPRGVPCSRRTSEWSASGCVHFRDLPAMQYRQQLSDVPLVSLKCVGAAKALSLMYFTALYICGNYNTTVLRCRVNKLWTHLPGRARGTRSFSPLGSLTPGLWSSFCLDSFPVAASIASAV